MRSWLAILVGAAFLTPASASAQMLSSEQAQHPAFQSVSAHPAECSRLRRQVDHFQTMHSRATVLENEFWAERLENHIERLRGLQAARCPGDLPEDEIAKAFAVLMKLAVKGAVTYFTLGMGGL